MTKLTSAMELLTLFHKTDFSVLNTTVYAHKLLSVLLTFVNQDVSQGYKAWPATELLMRRTGMGKTSLSKYRQGLLDANLLLQIDQNAGPGRSCVYYVNAPLIKKLAAQCGAVVSERLVGEAVLPPTRPVHKRNTAGLLNQPAKPLLEEFDSDPWAAPEVVSKAPQIEVKQGSGTNPDGSPMYFKNGMRRYTWDDVMPPITDQTEDQPF
jgi:hypothetical protein